MQFKLEGQIIARQPDAKKIKNVLQKAEINY
jgi:hypothetical protein